MSAESDKSFDHGKELESDKTCAYENPWQKSYPADIHWNSDIPQKTMVELFDEAVKKYQHRECVSFMDKNYNYRQIGEMVDRFAANLQKQGVGPGQQIGVCMPNNPYYIVAYYGILKAGATVVNLNPLYADEEMKALLKDSQTRMVVTANLPQVQPKLEKMLGLPQMPLEKVISCDFADLLPAKQAFGVRMINGACRLVPGMKSWRDKKGIPDLQPTKGRNVIPFAKMLKGKGKVTPAAITPDTPAVLQFTGGTTGIPKAATLTHGNLAANTQQSAIWFSAGRQPQDIEKVMTVLPFFHVFSMTVQMNLSLHMGDQIILMKPAAKLDMRALLKTMEQEKATVFAGVPNLYKGLLEVKGVEKYDLSSLKTCVSGAAPMPEQTAKAWKDLTGVEIVEGYGMSETSPLIVANPLTGVKKANSVGLPVPGTEIKFANIEFPDQTVPIKMEGEICVRGPQIMQGYWNRPEATAEMIDKDGFLHTGDVGYMDEDGYTFIVDRIKDMVIVNGFKAFPRHIEDAIRSHPAVNEVIVLGVKDEDKGEAVKAFIVLNPGQKVTAEELTGFLKDKLVHYEMPKAKNIEFRDDLPKTMIGKPDKKALKEEEKRKAEAAASLRPPAP